MISYNIPCCHSIGLAQAVFPPRITPSMHSKKYYIDKEFL